MDSLIGQPYWTPLLGSLIGQPYWTTLFHRRDLHLNLFQLMRVSHNPKMRVMRGIGILQHVVPEQSDWSRHMNRGDRGKPNILVPLK